MSTQSLTRYLTIANTRFHYRWLRNMCQCKQCLDQLTSEQVQQRASSSEPLTVEQQDDKLIIDWNENPAHRSIYSIRRLLACVGNSQVENLKSPIILWDKAQLDSNSVEKFDPNICSQETWMNQLFKFGFVDL